MPGQVGQMRRKVHRVLAGAAADLQHLCSPGKRGPQHIEYRRLVSLAGFGEGQHTVAILAHSRLRYSNESSLATVTPPRFRLTLGDLRWRLPSMIVPFPH